MIWTTDRQMDGQMNGRTDRPMDKVKPVHPHPLNFVGEGFIGRGYNYAVVQLRVKRLPRILHMPLQHSSCIGFNNHLLNFQIDWKAISKKFQLQM